MPSTGKECERIISNHHRACTVPTEGKCLESASGTEGSSDAKALEQNRKTYQENTQNFAWDYIKDEVTEAFINEAVPGNLAKQMNLFVEVSERTIGKKAVNNILFCSWIIDTYSMAKYGKDAGAVNGVNEAIEKGFEATPKAFKQLFDEGFPAIRKGLWGNE